MKKVCMIGLGEMGKRHAKDLEEFSNSLIRIAGVVEPSDKKFEIGCKWMGRVPDRFDFIKAMLDKTDPDGVVIATPNYLHLECLRELAGRGIPLILEKPLDTGLEKVREIAAFSKQYKAPIMVHHVMRYSPIVLKAKELLDSGAIGKICGFNMVQFMNGSPMFQNFRRTFKTGGGQLLEKATHDFDILLFLTGCKPKSVFSICKRQYFGGNRPNGLRCSNCNENKSCRHNIVQKSHDIISGNNLCVFADEIDIFDNESCLIELDNGMFGTYSQCFFSRAPFSRRYEFNGSTGFISIDFSMGKILLKNLKLKRREECFDFDYHGRIHYNGAPGVAKHFLKLMNDTTACVHSPVNEAVDAELISFAAYKSNETKRVVNIADLNKVSTS